MSVRAEPGLILSRSTVHIPLEQFPVITRIGKSAGLGCLGDRTETFLQKRKTLLNTVI